MASRRESLEQLRALPFRDAFRLTTRVNRGSWNSVTTGLGAMVTLWMIHSWIFFSFDNTPSLLGMVLLPVGVVVVTHGWVYSRVLVMFLGIAIGFVGAAGPFWIMNAT